MPKQREVGLENIPAPGEPLKQHIHEDNKRLLEDELKERMAIAKSKLGWQAHNRVSARYHALHRYLNRYHYNHIVKVRWDCWQEFQRLKHELKSASDKKRPALIRQFKQVKAQGKKLNSAIAKLQPLADEFARLAQRLKAHKDVLEWERKDAIDRQQFRREAKTWEEQLKAVFRQSARLHHRYENKRGKFVTKILIIERVIFKEDRVLFQIRTTSQSLIKRFFGRWDNALPYNVDVTDLTCDETLENLSAACRRPVTIERSNSGTQIFYAISRLNSLDGIPKKQLYGKVINWYPIADHAKTPWAAGVSKDRKVEWYNFEELPHVLIAGSTKSGKSNHVNQMIATLASMNTPAELRLLLVDLKGGIEFTHWSGLKHQLRPMVKSADKVLDALQYMRTLMERRLAAFEAIKAKNLQSYNAKAKDKLPRLVCFVDEMATLLGLGELTTAIHNELRVLSSQGRAVGVHLVLCTQHSSVDVLPGWVKTNMTLRISGKMPSHQASMVILDSVTAASLPNIPGRLVFSVGRYELIAQSPFISDDEVALAVAESNKFPDADNSEFDNANPVIVVKEKFTEADAIELALTKFGGKLSPTRLHDELGNDIITERKLRGMIDDLIDRVQAEGLEHHGQQYKIRKDRKSWVLEPIGQAVGHNSEGDTEELKPLVYPIEEN